VCNDLAVLGLNDGGPVQGHGFLAGGQVQTILSIDEVLFTDRVECAAAAHLDQVLLCLLQGVMRTLEHFIVLGTRLAIDCHEVWGDLHVLHYLAI